MLDIFLFAGETSGDLHGAPLVAAIKRKHPDAHIWGVGGPQMRAAGLKAILKTETFNVMGFVDVFFALPSLITKFFFLRRQILKQKPSIALFIDYPGFNLAMAKSLKKKQFKGTVCQYICPSVWAWNKGRIPQMEKTLDKLFTIFPFEQKLFDREKLSVEFVGHPLKPPSPAKGELITLFPGSRDKEIKRNLSTQIAAAKKLFEEFPTLTFAVSVAKTSFAPLIEKELKKAGLKASLFPATETKKLIQNTYLALAKSGTITLELALSGVPTVVTYGIGPLDLLIARKILKIDLPHYCIVNIIAGETLYPELIGPRLSVDALHREARALLLSEEKWQFTREKCLKICTMLSEKRPEEEIAESLCQKTN